MLIICDINQMSPVHENVCKGFPLIGLQIKQYYMLSLAINHVILEKIRNITTLFSSNHFLCHLPRVCVVKHVGKSEKVGCLFQSIAGCSNILLQ